MFAVIPQRLRDDRTFCLDAVRNNVDLFAVIPQSMKEDREISLSAVTANPDIFKDIPPALQEDRTFCLDVVAQAGTVFRALPSSLRSEFDFCLEATARNPLVSPFIPHFSALDTQSLQDARTTRGVQAVRELVAHLTNMDGEVREHTMLALGRIAHCTRELVSPHAATILASLADPEFRVRLAAPAVLMSLDELILPYLEDLEALAASADPPCHSAIETTLEWLDHLPEAKKTLARIRRSIGTPMLASSHSCH